MTPLVFVLIWLIVLILVIWCVQQLSSLPPFNANPSLLILIEVVVVILALVYLLTHFEIAIS